jgi:hypothetical protein
VRRENKDLIARLKGYQGRLRRNPGADKEADMIHLTLRLINGMRVRPAVKQVVLAVEAELRRRQVDRDAGRAEMDVVIHVDDPGTFLDELARSRESGVL